ncbi:UNVERIFIED_CONTAM: hypothetical protein Sradi_6660300 [Sesamum radiatum]|uniref:Reverse transcriptase domain-containing protein n=1 Tax=Sesamum radiatum TaxID=300843 RepID=A0AAW2JNX5_SESRA
MLISLSQSGFVLGRLIGDNILLAQEMIHSLDKRFTQLVKNAIENCWFTVLINGETAGFFKSTQGLRQGDPISSALFILAVEALSRDDIIIFTNSDESNLEKLMDFLEHYEIILGQRINHSKSAFISSTRANIIAQRIKTIIGFARKDLPITYLGAPLYKGKKKIFLYADLLDKVKKNISGWEHAFLSHEEGGLGIKNFRDMVEAFSYKLWWRFRLNDSLWALFPKNKYCKANAPATAKVSQNDSSIWRRLCKVRHDAQNNMFWTLGKGEVSFWHDCWLREGLLYITCGHEESEYVPVNRFWFEGKWNLEELLRMVPPQIANIVAATPFFQDQQDQLFWKYSKDGRFSTTSA